jgi:hypothetical protein
VKRPVIERMAFAYGQLIAAGRTPRVFYLNADDMAEFAATNPPTVEAMFSLPLGSKPQPMTCLAFVPPHGIRGIAVRQTTAQPVDKRGRPARSSLFCCAGTNKTVPWE